MKNIEWLKEEIWYSDRNIGLDWKEFVLNLIDQLDEPEVKQLERKIKELESFNDELIRDNNQLRNALDNQEVLSQELPVIPKFVGDWIEKCKDFYDYDGSTIDLFGSYDDLDSSGPYLINTVYKEERNKILDWVLENVNIYARAWLDGFTVEETEYRRVLKVGKMYFWRGGDSQGDFVVELTDNRRLAYVFDDEEEAINMQNEIGGEVEELEE